MPTESEPTRYRFAAWTVESAFAMPELPLSIDEPDWRVACRKITPSDRHVSWHQRANSADGQPWVWLGSKASVDVARFPARAWCVFGDDGRDVGCTWQRDLGDDMRAQMLVNHILPLAASRASHLVLHAAVVGTPSGGAMAIIGAAGAGKSTLAAYLGTRGWPILSDDRLIVDSARRALPVAPIVRLAPDAASRLGIRADLPAGHHKVRVRLGQENAPAWAVGPRRLTELVVLQRTDGEPLLERMTSQRALIEILRAQLQLGIGRRGVRARTFEMTSDVIANVPCRQLGMQRAWKSLAVAASLLEQVD